MDYIIENLTKKEAGYIGEKINEIVPREVDADNCELDKEDSLAFHLSSG